MCPPSAPLCVLGFRELPPTFPKATERKERCLWQTFRATPNEAKQYEVVRMIPFSEAYEGTVISFAEELGSPRGAPLSAEDPTQWQTLPCPLVGLSLIHI